MAENQEIKQTIKVEGQAALDMLRQHSLEQQRFADSMKKTASEGEETTKKAGLLSRAFDGLGGALRGLVGQMLGVGGVLFAIRSIRQEMEAAARATEQFARASLNLQFLSQTFDPQEREFVTRAATFAGRPVDETVRSFADLRSRFPNLSQSEVQALFTEVAETARTTDAPLSAITESFATARQFIESPQAAQNVLRESIIQAGISDPSALGPLFARAVPVLTGTGGLTPEQAFGAVAGATGLGLPGNVATTGLINTTLALTGKGTPEGVKLLRRLGVDRSDLFTALRGVSGALQAGQLDNAQLESIVGREGLSVVQLLSDPVRLADFEAKVGAVAGAGASTRDLTREAIQNQFRGDKVAATNFALQQARVEQSRLISTDVNALETELARTLLDIELRNRGAGAVRRAVSGAQFNFFTPFTEDAIGALGKVDTLGLGSDFSGAGVDVAGQLGQVRGGAVLFDQTININPVFNGPAPLTEEVGKSTLP